MRNNGLTEWCIECLHFVLLEELGASPLSLDEVVQFALLYVLGVHLDVVVSVRSVVLMKKSWVLSVT